MAEERSGQWIDHSLLKNTLSMLADLGIDGTSVYEQDFETPFLQVTREFYRRESSEFIASNTCSDYLRKAEARLAEESGRVDRYLHISTEPKLRAIVEHELVLVHAKALVEMEKSGCVAMLRDEKLDDLRRMYDLFDREAVKALDLLRDTMCDYVKKVGRQLVADQERQREPVEFVKGLLEMREKYDRVVFTSFRSEKRSQKRLKEAFEDFINADHKCASYLVQYLDELLRNALKGLTESEADIELDRVVVIFRYLQDKDIFENLYKTCLAKRLLSGRSLSDEHERNMISKLKKECGYQYTSKIEGMFTDMRMSKGTMEQYRRAKLDRMHGVQMEVDVLTAGYWPTDRVQTCTLPPKLTKCCETFSTFYLNKHSGRKLVWQTSMGTADIKATFANSWHELNVSTYQMCILVLFNGTDKHSLADIRAATQIPERELKRHLVSLCTPKHRILRKSSKGKGVSNDDSFSFNPDYSSKLKRVKVPLVSMKESTPVDTNACPPAVEEDRRHLIEAAVVRVMKARKVLGHNDLIGEVTRQLSHRFMPSPPFIKARVESLIEREYLERDKSDRRAYRYLA